VIIFFEHLADINGEVKGREVEKMRKGRENGRKGKVEEGRGRQRRGRGGRGG
jgi:hypothetical protein